MDDEGVVVRRCTALDWEKLKAIRLESLGDTPEAYGSTYDDAATWPDERWRSVASQWKYWLGERHGRVVGMVSGAAQLVDEVSKWARGEGVTSLYLHVTSTVLRARAFYEKTGFEPTGEVIVMDRDPSLRLVTMVRDLG